MQTGQDSSLMTLFRTTCNITAEHKQNSAIGNTFLLQHRYEESRGKSSGQRLLHPDVFQTLTDSRRVELKTNGNVRHDRHPVWISVILSKSDKHQIQTL